ncbi:hypothetical protein, partial [Ureibacillus terrenus]|uniref:hypothetical protein n=1 Tax=Ureibacillus terrenus TaxID=118246 RepID=UPI002E244DA6|nr:hypothetical protein [Ureibacillus terrenus]
MEKTMSSLNKRRILENDEQKKTNPNSNEAFELGFVDSLKGLQDCSPFLCIKNPYQIEEIREKNCYT